MSSVDNRVVAMKFDNAQFESGVKTTMSTMDRLKQALNFTGASKGLEQVSGAAGGISAKFLAMSTIAITALSNIANKAINVGTQVVKSLTLDPVMQGFSEYELKMGSIQTIMAGSGASLDEVNKKLNELNTYSDKTIYSFKDMTSNIGKFTNAGVSLDTSVAAIQGIANVAALSGANADEASRAMYNFAQSLSAGSVKLMDWKSIELANMATVEFKTQLMESAVAAGTLKKQVDGTYKTLENTPVTATKGFNESLKDQWLTSEALVKTLGDYSNEQTDIGKRATAAAQDVKTFSQMMDTLKESAGSGWAQTSEIIFGNFAEGKGLWTSINNVFGGMISASADARNKLLQDWKDLGGRTALIDGIKNSFNALKAVLKPVQEAFRSIFPPTTAATLMAMTTAFQKFSQKLTVSGEMANNIKRTFAGLFAVLDIGKQIFMGVFGVIKNLLGEISGAPGGILKFTGGIGDMIVKFDQALKNGTALATFFKKLTDILKTPIQWLKKLGDVVGNTFDIFKSKSKGAADGVGGAVDNMKERLSGFEKVLNALKTAWKAVVRAFQSAKEAIAPVMSTISDALGGFWDKLSEVFNPTGFAVLLSGLNVGLFGAIGLMIKRFISGGIGVDFGGGLFEGIKNSFEQLTGTLKTMQQQVKAKMLMQIAAAVGILTVSIVALAMIDPVKLASAMTAIAAGFSLLVGSMVILTKFTGTAGFGKLPMMSAAMILLAIAIDILASAVKKLSDLDWDGLAKGLVGVGALLAMMVVVAKVISKDAGKMISSAVAIIALGVALKLLASVMKDFAGLSWAEIGAGLISVAGALLLISASMKVMPKNMAATGLGLVLVVSALKKLVGVVNEFAGMDWSTIGKGLLGVGGSLLVIAAAMQAMPKNMLLTAPGLIVVGYALGLIGKAVGEMGKMGWGEVARGLVTLAGSLAIIAGAMYLMSGALPGALALIVVAGALKLLVPVLITLGTLPWKVIALGLGALAAVFVVLGLAGLALSPVIATILLLGIAVGLLGAGLALAGAGIFLFVTAFTAMAAIGKVGMDILLSMMESIAAAIPRMLTSLAQGLIDFALKIATGGQQFTAAFTTLLDSILNAIINVLPKVEKLFNSLIDLILNVLQRNIPKIIQAGVNILLAFLDGLARNIPQIARKATDVVIAFIQAIGREGVRLADAGMRMIVDFVNGLANAIDRNAGQMRAAGGNLARAIIDGMTGGLLSGASKVASQAANMAKGAFDAAKKALGVNSPSKVFIGLGQSVNEGFVDGLDKDAHLTAAASANVANQAVTSAVKVINGMADMISTEMNIDPVIAPVLDLSNIQKDASKIDSMLATSPVVASVSYGQASSISSDQQASNATSVVTTPEPAAPTLIFTQTNTSPTALSSADIYRQTKNQLSLAKEALKIT